MKTVVESFFRELVDAGNLDAIDDLVARDYVGHFPGMDDVQGPSGLRSLMEMYNGGFSDRSMRIHDLIGEDDRVAARLTFTATHSGEVAGIAPTGARVEVDEMNIFRFVQGRIAEHWVVEDDLALLRQIGATALPGEDE